MLYARTKGVWMLIQVIYDAGYMCGTMSLCVQEREREEKGGSNAFVHLQNDDTDRRSHKARLFLLGITPMLYLPFGKKQ